MYVNIFLLSLFFDTFQAASIQMWKLLGPTQTLLFFAIIMHLLAGLYGARDSCQTKQGGIRLRWSKCSIGHIAFCSHCGLTKVLVHI